MEVQKERTTATIELLTDSPQSITISVSGRLDVHTTGEIWRRTEALLEAKRPQTLIVHAANVTYCDEAGISLFLMMRARLGVHDALCDIQELKEEYKKAIDFFLTAQKETPSLLPQRREGFIETVGRDFVMLIQDIYAQLLFVGELGCTFWQALIHPALVRWKDVWNIVYRGGVEAVPIVLLLNFLMGLIMAFQAAIPMGQFGADIYVADLVGLSIMRELGPLMSAVILAGRSSSAFAAELGTMKVNEELDALQTMGLKPIRFLVINRVIAVIIFTPILTLFAVLAGLIGGAVVFTSLGYPLVTYINELLIAVHFNDFFGGFVKSFVFAFFIASIGCLRGLQTKTGASAVGLSATRAVVSGLVLIVLIDGIFSIVYYYLGI